MPTPPPAAFSPAAAAFSLAAAALLPSALSPPFLDDARDDGPFKAPFEPPDDSPDENSSQWSGDGVDAARVVAPSATPLGEFNPKLFERRRPRCDDDDGGPGSRSSEALRDSAAGLRLVRLRDDPTRASAVLADPADPEEEPFTPLAVPPSAMGSFTPAASGGMAAAQCSMSPSHESLATRASSKRVVSCHRRFAPHSLRPCPFFALSTSRQVSSLPRLACTSAIASTAVALARFRSVFESSKPLPCSFADAAATSRDTISAFETSGWGNLSALSMARMRAQIASSLSLASAGPSRGMDRSLENLPPPS
mmetsp:Transcript_1789/g.6992  ORF Transcript_1789/g.6992 Transcript_1789/m.6992 type:complete len:309 (-) Transcript_1789:661-1587(-)